MVLKTSDLQKQCFQERRCFRTLVLEGFHLQESYHFRLSACAARTAAWTQEIEAFLISKRNPSQTTLFQCKLKS